MLLTAHKSLFDPPPARLFKPRTLAREEWLQADYLGIYAWRLKQMKMFDDDPLAAAAAKAYYAQPCHAKEFIQHFMDTFDPRRATLKWLPFVFFEKQDEFIDFLQSCLTDKEDALTEKCRDMGATWLCCAFSVWAWLFVPNVAIGWGSRKEELVDRLGDNSSIFEKIRQLTDRIPRIFLPKGFNRLKHATFMKMLNPENGATITGESGDNIGRGGRTSIYFKDESAHYERPELIQAALDDNTNVQIDISSVNGLGNVFHKKREAGVDWPACEPGKTRVFVFDYSDHPLKDAAWYERRRSKAEAEGLLHLFAQEVERNYAAAVQNAIIPMEWIIASRDAHLTIRGMLDGPPHGGFDVADGGGDSNAFVDIKGVVCRYGEIWGSRDPGVAARKVIAYFKNLGINIDVNYDNIGVGATVKAEINRIYDDEQDALALRKLPNFIGWNAGAKVQNPFDNIVLDDLDTPTNIDFFGNMKAQAWWSARCRFLRTYQCIKFGVNHPPETMISLSTRNPLIRTLEKELAQPTYTQNGALKMIIDKKPDGAKSPNLADALVMGYFPAEQFSSTPLIGRYGNG